MANDSPNGAAFRVVYSQRVQNQIKALAQRARQAGIGREFVAALRAIDTALRRSPATFGDPSHRLTAAKLTVSSRVRRPLLVTFSVHRDKAIVFVRSFRPFPRDAF